MEEDLGQPNTINLSAYCQDTGSRILGIFLSEHLGQLATQLIGTDSQHESYENVSCHEREVAGNVVEDRSNGCPGLFSCWDTVQTHTAYRS